VSVFVNLSGGLDSTFAALRLLEAGEHVTLNHISLRNHQGRHTLEDRAVKRITRWFRDKGLTNFTLLEPTVDFGDVGRMGYRFPDVETAGFMTGVALRAPSRRRIERVAISANGTDPLGQNPDHVRGVRQRKLAETVAMRPIRWEYPINDVSKTSITRMMPPDLFALCWWCREPRGEDSCGRCHTCRQVHRALAADGKPVPPVFPRRKLPSGTPSDCDLIINLSGGIDSAYCLYWALQEGYRPLVHRTRLTNHEGRQDVEDAAVERILDWMTTHGDFTFVRSEFDYGTLHNIVKDFEVVSFWTGVMLRNPGHDMPVLLSVHEDSPSSREDGWEHTQRKAIFSAMGVAPEFVWPIQKITKAEVIRRCPTELFELTWWCRRPQDGKRCNRCLTCRQVKAGLATKGAA